MHRRKYQYERDVDGNGFATVRSKEINQRWNDKLKAREKDLGKPKRLIVTRKAISLRLGNSRGHPAATALQKQFQILIF